MGRCYRLVPIKNNAFNVILRLALLPSLDTMLKFHKVVRFKEFNNHHFEEPEQLHYTGFLILIICSCSIAYTLLT